MKKLAFVALLVLGVSATAQAGDIAKGAELANQCSACHGKDGNSTQAMWPKLAGQSAEYLKKQIKDFKSGERVDASMAPMVANLTDENIDDLAAYFASQSIQYGAVKEDFVEMGKNLYFNGDAERGIAACAACHGAKGNGLDLAKYPALGGQHPTYTKAQLKKFAAADRSNDANSVMRDIAIRMSQQQIEAISEFLLGLH